MLDIAFHDTYFVIGGYQIAFFVGSFFLISWLLFRFIPAFRALRWLARIHLAGTTITTILIFLLLSNMIQESQPKRYTDYSVYTELNQPQSINTDWFPVLLYAFLLLQLSWFVQLIAWYYYKARSSNG